MHLLHLVNLDPIPYLYPVDESGNRMFPFMQPVCITTENERRRFIARAAQRAAVEAKKPLRPVSPATLSAVRAEARRAVIIEQF